MPLHPNLFDPLRCAWRALAAASVLAVLSACAPVQVLNSLASASGGHLVKRDQAYGPGPRQQMDIYTPTTPAPAAGWPLVVFFYGGSWNTGSRAEYAFVGSNLAAHGIVAVVADYRLYPEVRYPDFLRDCAQALAWSLQAAPSLGADSRRVFVMGHSAGAYNAAMLALDPRWLAATGHAPAELAGWIGLAGPYDFFPTDDANARPVFFHPNYPPHAQPIEFAPPDAPRSFIAAPSNDKVVDPVRSSQQLARRLEAAGVPVMLKMYGGASHATLIGAFAFPLRWIAPVLDDVTVFVEAAPALTLAAVPASAAASQPNRPGARPTSPGSPGSPASL